MLTQSEGLGTVALRQKRLRVATSSQTDAGVKITDIL